MKILHHCKTCNSSNLKIVIKGLCAFNYLYDVVVCLDCGLRFRNIELDINEIERIYSNEYFTKNQKNFFFNSFELRRSLFLNKLKLIDQFYEDKGEILDMGSGIGTFVQVARDEGWTETGLEISSFAAEYSKQKGLNIINSDFSYVLKLKEKFDAVTLWDTVDHAEKPIELLHNVREVIKEDGYIFVETVVTDSIIYVLAEMLCKISLGLIKGPLIKGYPMHHSNYYSEKTLKRDIEMAGFRVVKIDREPLNNEVFSGEKLGEFYLACLKRYQVFFAGKLHVLLSLRQGKQVFRTTILSKDTNKVFLQKLNGARDWYGDL